MTRSIISTGEHEWPAEQRSSWAHIQQFPPRRKRDRIMPHVVAAQVGILAALALILLERAFG